MKKEDTNSYKGWLNSDSIIKRSLAVFGYSMVGVVVVYVPLVLFAFLWSTIDSKFM